MPKIQVKRGEKSKLPFLDIAEFALTTDSHEVFVGTDSGNTQLVTLDSDGYINLAFIKTWDALESLYDYTIVKPEDKTSKPYSYTETLSQDGQEKARLVTTFNADGSFTKVYTIGENSRTINYTKQNNTIKGVWL